MAGVQLACLMGDIGAGAVGGRGFERLAGQPDPDWGGEGPIGGRAVWEEGLRAGGGGAR